MNIEATSSKPQEDGFLSQFSVEQQDFLKKAGIENKEIFDLMIENPTFKSEFEAEKLRSENSKKETEIEKTETKKISESERNTLSAEVQIGILEDVEKTPITPENSVEIQKKLEIVGASGANLGIDSLPVRVTTELEKSLHRVDFQPGKNKPIHLDLVDGKLKIGEGVEEFDESYLVMAALDAAFQNQIPDSTLAKLDRFEIAKLASIFESGSFEKDETVALTPRAVRGFLALAKKANYDFAELQKRGIFDEEWKVKTYPVRSFANLNAGELRETAEFEARDIFWNKKERSKKENDEVSKRG